MRLIDADELKKKFNERSYWTYTHEYGDAIPIGWIMSGIDNAPTVDNEMLTSERQQGEWIFDGVYRDENNPIDNDMYHCNLCKRGIMTTSTRPEDLFPFCHCGARMKRSDGE